MRLKTIRRVELIHNVQFLLNDYKKAVMDEKIYSGERVLRAVSLTSVMYFLEYFGISQVEIFDKIEDIKLLEECRVISIEAYSKCVELKDFNDKIIKRVALG